MKIYISGKITGLDLETAKRNFKEVEEIITEMGHEPINPFNIMPYDPKLTWSDYMAADLKELLDCKAIFMLENWRESKGAKIEYAVAVELKLIIKHLPITIGEYREL